MPFSYRVKYVDTEQDMQGTGKNVFVMAAPAPT